MIKYRCDYLDSRKNKEYTSEEDIKLLKYIKNKSREDWTIPQTINWYQIRKESFTLLAFQIMKQVFFYYCFFIIMPLSG